MKRKIKTYHEKFDKFYQSKEWQHLRQAKWVASEGLCEMCRAKGIIRSAKEIHHRIPIEEEWSKRLDYDTLVVYHDIIKDIFKICNNTSSITNIGFN